MSLLESMESGHMTQPAVAVVKHLVKIVSEIYLDPSDTSYKAAVEESMDLDFVGPRLESVATMMDRIQGALLRFLGEIDGHAKFSFTQGPLEVGWSIPFVSVYKQVQCTSERIFKVLTSGAFQDAEIFFAQVCSQP